MTKILSSNRSISERIYWIPLKAIEFNVCYDFKKDFSRNFYNFNQS